MTALVYPTDAWTLTTLIVLCSWAGVTLLKAINVI